MHISTKLKQPEDHKLEFKKRVAFEVRYFEDHRCVCQRRWWRIDNRLEVISPGILYGNIDIADIGTGISECRNRSIVRIFRKMSFMEELGTGIARIVELFREKISAIKVSDSGDHRQI